MPPRSKRDPFSVRLSAEQERDLVQWLADEISSAESARSAVIGEGGQLDTWHWLYEQGQRRGSAERGADLGSYIPCEKVDALRARMVKTIFTEPIWVVEGWGQAADRAPLVEEFHQWKAEEERLQAIIAKTFHQSLVEGTGVLEVYEQREARVQMRQERAAVALNEQGGLVFGENGQPQPMRDGLTGAFQPPESDDVPSADLQVRDASYVRRGPGYRVLSLRDFLFLPGHAATVGDCWGFAKRFWRRVPELERREQEGHYRHVSDLGTEDERTLTLSQQRAGQDLSSTNSERTAEKELWEIVFLWDHDDDGLEEWYVATLSVRKRVLVRLQHDDLNLRRYLPFTPFPRADSVYGYSFVGHKLATVTAEHTALRNMIADRSALATQAPIKRMQGALWDPDMQPFGPRAIIDVRDLRELEPMVIPDVPASAIEREKNILAAAERISGLNDLALGTQPTESRTLGEVQLTTEQSFVRMEESIRHCQETLEDLFQLRHAIWIRALEQQETGIEAPSVFVETLTARDIQLQNGRITAETLRGTFRGKPRGSVETADLTRQRADFNGFLQAAAALSKAMPGFAQVLQSPEVMQSVLEQVLRVYRIPDRQVWLEAVKQSLMAMQQAQTMRMLLPQMGAGGPAPMGAAMPGRAPLPPGGGVPSPLAAQIPPTGPMQAPQQAALQRGPGLG